MLNLSNLNCKEKIYLAELVNYSKLMSPGGITYKTLSSLKPGVLEHALEITSKNLAPGKVTVLNRIINKIAYPALIDGEILVPIENRLLNKLT